MAYGAFAAARLHYLGGDPSGFVVAGDAFADRDEAPTNLLVQEDSAGYDGVFFYRLALDPFTGERSDFGITIDAPAYRQQRILYPLITWALSAGSPTLVPALLVAVNWIGLGVIAFLAATFCQRAGHRPLWGLVVAGHPGFVLSLARDLSEITAAAFVIGGLVAWQRSRFAVAAIVLSLAALARETTLLVPLGLAVGTWIESRSKRAGWLLMPAAVFALWQLGLATRWGVFPFEASTALALPFTGIARFVATYVPPEGAVALSYLAGAGYLAGVVAVTGLIVQGSGARPPMVATWLAYLTLTTALSFSVWIEDVSFLRATTELQMFSVLLLVGSRRSLGGTRALGVVGLATAALWLAQVWIRIGHL